MQAGYYPSDAQGGYSGAQGGYYTASDPQQALVWRVREFQQNQPDQKHKWWSFCASQGKLEFDPANHDAAFLQKFFEHLEKDQGKGKGGKGSRGGAVDMSKVTNKIFVAGLPLETPSKDAIWHAFSQYGPVEDVEMKYDSTGFRGFCFVSFQNTDAARRVLANKGAVYVGNKIVDCKAAVPKDKMEGGGKGWGGDWSSWDDMLVPWDPMMGMWGSSSGGKGKSGGKEGKGSSGSAAKPSAVSAVLRIRGVPHEQNTEEAIRGFFMDFNVVKVLANVGTDRDGRPRGEAYVAFTEVSESSRALNTMNYATMGTRYIELFNSSPEEMSIAEKEKSLNLQSLSAELPTTTVLRLRGLPFKASAVDICEFFSGYRVLSVLAGVISPADGRPKGEAFAEFMSAEDCTEALRGKQHATMESRYIELFPSSSQEMLRAAAESSIEPVDAATALASGEGGRMSNNEAKIFVGALPKIATEDTVRAYFSQFGEIDHVIMGYDQAGISRGFCFVVFKDKTSAEAVLDNVDNNMIEGQWVSCKPANEGKGEDGKGKGKKGKGCKGKGKGKMGGKEAAAMMMCAAMMSAMDWGSGWGYSDSWGSGWGGRSMPY